jgi:hypothetical protein
MNTTYVQKNSTVQKIADSKAAPLFDSSSQGESLQRKADMANNAAQRAETPRPNNTGLPDNLKSGIESLSGFSMDDVRVHYNSSKPATVQALAYTQGTDIHVAPGQEKCLPHEAWHVAQQMAGRVSPTTNINGMPVNDNAGLEHEADVMGEKAVQCKGDGNVNKVLVNKGVSQGAIQCIQSRIKDFPETSFGGRATESDRFPVIAFEVMAGVDRVQEIENLYNNVIRRYEGPAHIYIGVNKISYDHPGFNANGEPKSQPNEGNARALEHMVIPVDLNNAVGNLQTRIGGMINANHQIHIIPFIYVPTYNPKRNQAGGYTFPFMEARRLLMTAADGCNASVFRWIDSDVDDDTSIDVINTKGNEEFRSPTGPVVYSGYYNWRGGGVDKINKHELFFRKFFWYYHGFGSEGNEYDGIHGYIPEPIAYMNKAAHGKAKEQLAAKVDSLAYNGSDSCQQNEAREAFSGCTMIFRPEFSVSKPVKAGYAVNAPNESLDELSSVRQSAFGHWDWLGLNRPNQDLMKARVLNVSKGLNGLLSEYNVRIKKENESILLSAIFEDIINPYGDKTINEIVEFLKWKAKFENVKCIGALQYVETSIGGHLLLNRVHTCPYLIADEPPSKFLVV